MSEQLPWWDKPLWVFDIESTGVNPQADRIVTAALAMLSPDGKILEEYSWLVNPGVEIPLQAQQVHGISNEIAQQKGQEASAAVAEIAAAVSALEAPLAGYNIAYDLTMLFCEAKRYQAKFDLDHLAVLDPLVCDRHFDTYRRGPRRLENVVTVYEVSLENAHTAYDDAVAAGKIMYKMAEKYPFDPDPAKVHESEKQWYAQWAENYQQYVRTNRDPQFSISPSWPLPENLS